MWAAEQAMSCRTFPDLGNTNAYILMSNAIFGNVGDFADDVEDSKWQ
jgi:hypothetical protein